MLYFLLHSLQGRIALLYLLCGMVRRRSLSIAFCVFLSRFLRSSLARTLTRTLVYISRAFSLATSVSSCLALSLTHTFCSSPTGLCCMHFYLVCIGATTHEEMTGTCQPL